MGERVQAEVAPLEPALTQVPSLGKGYRLVVVGAHRQRVAGKKGVVPLLKLGLPEL